MELDAVTDALLQIWEEIKAALQPAADALTAIFRDISDISQEIAAALEHKPRRLLPRPCNPPAQPRQAIREKSGRFVYYSGFT